MDKTVLFKNVTEFDNDQVKKFARFLWEKLPGGRRLQRRMKNSLLGGALAFLIIAVICAVQPEQTLIAVLAVILSIVSFVIAFRQENFEEKVYLKRMPASQNRIHYQFCQDHLSVLAEGTNDSFFWSDLQNLFGTSQFIFLIFSKEYLPVSLEYFSNEDRESFLEFLDQVKIV